MDYSTYQQQHQQSYDASQNQAYDQSTQSYYGYSHQYDQQYAYYSNQDQANLYAQQANQQFQLETTSIHPPGVPVLPEQTQMQNQYLVNPLENQHQSNMDSGAAVAVSGMVAVDFSQLTQSAGNPPPMGPPQYRGGGGRGSRPFRRGGRGHFNHRGRAPYRGRGRGRHFPSHSPRPANSYIEITPVAIAPTSVEQPSSSVSGPMSLPTLAQVPTAPSQPPAPRKVWCEICKVECNTAEILEQHKNGKRHKKNLQVHEELQRRKALNGEQSDQVPTSQLNLTVQVEKPPESKTEGSAADDMGSLAADGNPKDETEPQNNMGETSEVPADEPEGNPTDGFALPDRGSKRKMRGGRGGRGGKCIRTNDGLRRPVEPPKPKQVIPFICEVCNVKCDSQVVYDSHLRGKKHLKRVHAHQALYPEHGLQVLHPPDITALPNAIDINALTNSINSQVQQGVNDPQVLLAQLLMTVLSQTQASAVAPPPGSVAAHVPAPTPAVGSSYETQNQNVSEIPVSGSTGPGEKENLTGETKDQLETPETAGRSSESEEKTPKLAQNSSALTPADNSSAANEQGASSRCEASTS